VDFWVRQNGQVIEGGQSKNHPLILGESRFIPGFEEQLVEMKEGETKIFSLPFPADYYVKNLAGQLLDFEVKMNLVQESLVPEPTDEFAKSLGQFADLAALKQNVKDGLIEEKMQKAKEMWRGRVLNKIVKDSKMEVPPALVEMERVKMMEEFKNNLAQMGLEFDVYLENLKKTEQELLREWSGKAEERVKGALVLEEIANKEEIQVAEAEIEAEINKTFAHYPDWQALKSQIDKKQLSEYTKGRLRNEKVFELLERF
ncbi:MAG: trigger factor, partial [Candidatus Portnoybacteria bacterium CG02_land_8_20_14_3_00_45_8]